MVYKRMDKNLRQLSIAQRIQLVEDIWDSIADEQSAITLTQEQRTELDRRLDAYKIDGNKGRFAKDVISEIRKRL